MSTIIIKKTPHPRPLISLMPYTGVFEREQITHLLKRTMFGAKKTDIDFFIGKTLAESVNTLLTEPPPLTDAQLPLRNYAEGTLPMGATWAYAQQNPDFDGQRRNSLKIWWVGNMANQPRSIFEKMVLFWHNHFATGMLDSFSSMSFEHVLLAIYWRPARCFGLARLLSSTQFSRKLDKYRYFCQTIDLLRYCTADRAFGFSG
ncbi:MAG: DUF1800 family protein [Saprospiraceae bacterium]|nr:DUF1800 family protein [Saprospiraceae bacterium]